MMLRGASLEDNWVCMDSGKWGTAMGRTSIEMGGTRMFSVSPLSPFLSDSLKEIQESVLSNNLDLGLLSFQN